jgi:hypothetical protein
MGRSNPAGSAVGGGIGTGSSQGQASQRGSGAGEAGSSHAAGPQQPATSAVGTQHAGKPAASPRAQAPGQMKPQTKGPKVGSQAASVAISRRSDIGKCRPAVQRCGAEMYFRAVCGNSCHNLLHLRYGRAYHHEHLPP